MPETMRKRPANQVVSILARGDHGLVWFKLILKFGTNLIMIDLKFLGLGSNQLRTITQIKNNKQL